MKTTRPPTTMTSAHTHVNALRNRWFTMCAALLACGVFLCGWDFLEAAEPSPDAAAAAAAAANGAPAAAARAPVSDKVRITFVTVPAQKAMVYWGRKRLGPIAPRQPLIVERPRDSGPLDVIVRAAGFLSVQTRAYTFADSKVAVKLTAPDQKKTLLGYREAPPDAGAPPPAAIETRAPDAGVFR
jgi:hypothetical protein